MDQFKVGTEENSKPVDVPTALQDACAQMSEAMKPAIVKFKGRYDPGSQIIAVEGKCMYNPEIENLYQSMFFDFLYYLPIDVRGKTYRFELHCYDSPSFNHEVHIFQLQTSLDYIPDTGGITRQEWYDFIDQLHHYRDGEPADLPEPDPFLDDEIEEEDLM